MRGEDWLSAEGDGDVEFFSDFKAIKAGRRDADDLKGMSVERDGAAERRGASAEFALPERVADDCPLRAAAARSSEGESRRPSTGWMPRVLKKFPLTMSVSA
jgi:hypothetical protein